jgi:hypothetical protein
MVSIDCIAIPSEPDVTSIPLSELGGDYRLNLSRETMYKRYFGLRAVPRTVGTHRQMLELAFSRLLGGCSFQREKEGLLIYAKTQTHNTFFESDWLQDLSYSHGFGHWESLTVSMNHCASALSVIHLVKSMAERRLIVLLTGEKGFHPVVNRLSVGVLGEMPVATLLNSGAGNWGVTATAVAHEPQFYENLDDMADHHRTQLQLRFAESLQQFIEKTLIDCGLNAEDIDLIVPYNLNLPLLKRIAARFNWKDKLYFENIPNTGHVYCSDVLYNLGRVLPLTSARRILAFAGGLGVTFSSLILERNA